MARRPHFASEPGDQSDHRGSQLTPQALSKLEFGRRLQQLLHDRSWTQSDLVREANRLSPGRKIGRDAISTYVNGRSFPGPASLNILCRAFGVSREELFPNAVMSATNDEHPALELRMAAGQPGRAWVRVNRLLTFDTASKIVALINEEDKARTNAADES